MTDPYYAEFSESLFQFVYLRESLATLPAGVSFDILTLRQEKSRGYDATIKRSRSVFFQFKRSIHRQKHVSTDKHTLGPPWYEFWLHSANQHNLLRAISLSGEDAFYVAPLFMTKKALLHHARVGTVRVNSVKIKPDTKKKAANADHRYVYLAARGLAQYHSDEGEMVHPYPALDPAMEAMLTLSSPGKILSRGVVPLEETIERLGNTISTTRNVDVAGALQHTITVLQEHEIHWVVFREKRADEEDETESNF